MAGFDLGGISDAIGGLTGGKGLDVAALQPMWEQAQPALKGLDAEAILNQLADWAKNLDLPLIKDVPDSVIDDIKNGIAVPLKKLING